MKWWALLVAGLAACTHAPATPDPASQQVAVVVPATAAMTRDRVLQAFAADGLAVTESTGDVVTGTYQDHLTTVRVRGALVPVDSVRTRVVFTAFGDRPRMGALPAASAQVTATTGGLGKAAWARMERIAATLR